MFPALLENDVPFHIHEIGEYWNDVGSLGELRQGTFDALEGKLRLEMAGEEVSPGVIVAGARGLCRRTWRWKVPCGSATTCRSARACA